jgi:hypothetical protein
MGTVTTTFGSSCNSAQARDLSPRAVVRWLQRRDEMLNSDMTHLPPSATDAAATIAEAALRYVQTADGRVRVEDYLAVLGAITGEAALLAAGLFHLEQTDLAPGSAVFGDAINTMLSGDALEPMDAPAESVVGVLVGALVPAVFSVEDFPTLRNLYEGVARQVGSTAWGEVPTSVPEDNKPTLVPLRAAFEMRPQVDAACERAKVEVARRHIACALAVAKGLEQTRQAIDPRVGLKLTLEIIFGMAKTVPMSRKAFEAASRSH